ncbi:Maleate isomerase [Lachnellula hyalina]|uniref:Maleate isomerase n=1 Tax=Lachnellula hyalina TaxID=1316788 RepID=A0A8H8QUJ1_9HELO|nr:Maleate isomerase [Lachnellula hyalina]TVY22923.1 Maleate isomerase [Lachnellula hyalina]
MPPKVIRLGILVPSSNTALEPLTTSLLASINASLPNTPNFTAHFSRFPVTTISLSPTGLAQFDLAPILFAASLLAHANVDIIGWSGTAAGWLGFEKDAELCARIEEETGIKATTSVLALNKVLGLWGVERLGLVTPYLDDVQAKIVENYGKIGVQIVGEKHLRVEKNSAIADIGEEVLDGMVQDVIGVDGVQAVTTFCTNLIAAQRVKFWEEKHDIPVFDTVTTVVWDMLRELGVDMSGVEGWGMIFKK